MSSTPNAPMPSGARVLPFEAMRRLLRHGAYPNLTRLLRNLHESESAEMLVHLPPGSQRRLLERLPDRELAAEIFTYLDESARAALLPHLSTAFLVEIAKLLPPDDVAAILRGLPADRLEEVRAHFSDALAEELNALLAYDPETAGGIMTTAYLALEETLTAEEALETLRHAKEAETVFYVYIVDAMRHLVGVLSLRQLVLATPDTPLKHLMDTDVIRVSVDEDQEQTARLITQYDFLALPVVDRTGVLVGIITVDDIIDVIREETTEDMLRMAGVNPEEMLEGNVRGTVRHRLPWLFVSWLGGLIASYVIDTHQETLQKVAMLAAFFPIIIGMGGNTATQSLAVAIRGLATGSPIAATLGRAVLKEAGIGLSLGMIYGILLGAVAFFWHGSFAFGLVVGIAIWASMTIAALLGGLLPLGLNRVGVDPAVASGPFLTTAIDVIGLLLYLATARLFLLA